jgi:hypothetical protein
MAEQRSPIQFEDVPIDEARRMGPGPRMNPDLYRELRTKMASMSDAAVRMMITDGTSVATMKNWIRRVASDLGIPVTIRRVPGGLIFWRATDEDIQLAREVGERLQGAKRQSQARPRGRRPRGTR